jgi:hypothetical protein
MLHVNEVAEQGLQHGSVGVVKEIVYYDPSGPTGPKQFKQLPTYVVVEFPESNIPEANTLIPGLSRFCVPIAPITFLCEKKCCKGTQTLLRITKSSTIHKDQGTLVVTGKVWEKLMVDLAWNSKTPGLDQVTFSRTIELGCMVIYDDSEISIKMICETDKSPAYEKRCGFQQTLRHISTENTPPP